RAVAVPTVAARTDPAAVGRAAVGPAAQAVRVVVRNGPVVPAGRIAAGPVAAACRPVTTVRAVVGSAGATVARSSECSPCHLFSISSDLGAVPFRRNDTRIPRALRSARAAPTVVVNGPGRVIATGLPAPVLWTLERPAMVPTVIENITVGIAAVRHQPRTRRTTHTVAIRGRTFHARSNTATFVSDGSSWPITAAAVWLSRCTFPERSHGRKVPITAVTSPSTVRATQPRVTGFAVVHDRMSFLSVLCALSRPEPLRGRHVDRLARRHLSP